MTVSSSETSLSTFFLPGPTYVRPEVLAAMTHPMISHRATGFEELYERLQGGLRAIFRTSRPVYVSSSSATGLMEAAVRAAPAGPLLCLVGGAFGERFHKLATRCERESDVHQVPLGAPFDLNAVEAALRARRYSAVTVVHSESSTGVLTDVREIAALARAHGAMTIVDCVTSAGAGLVDADGWGVDFALTGSQKAMALPPGLAFGVASEAFAQAARGARSRGMYLDLVEFEEFHAKRQTPNTPALPLLFALDAQLDHIAQEGLETRFARHAAMLERTVAWAEACGARLPGMGILAPAGARSLTVSSVTLPAGVDGKQIVKAVGARGYTIGGGYGPLASRCVRIGHMGDHTLEGLERCLAVCEAAIGEAV